MERKYTSLQDMLKSERGIMTAYGNNPLTASVGTTPERILPGNPKRVSFVVCNTSSNTVYILPSNGVSTINGILLAPSGGTASLNWEVDGELVMSEWYAVANAAASPITILEVYMV